MSDVKVPGKTTDYNNYNSLQSNILISVVCELVIPV